MEWAVALGKAQKPVELVLVLEHVLQVRTAHGDEPAMHCGITVGWAAMSPGEGRVVQSHAQQLGHLHLTQIPGDTQLLDPCTQHTALQKIKILQYYCISLLDSIKILWYCNI